MWKWSLVKKEPAENRRLSPEFLFKERFSTLQLIVLVFAACCFDWHLQLLSSQLFNQQSINNQIKTMAVSTASSATKGPKQLMLLWGVVNFRQLKQLR